MRYHSNRFDVLHHRRYFLDTRKGLISRRKQQKTGFSVQGQKCVESLLIWIPLPKTQRRIKTFRYRPCDGTHNAATVSLTRGRVALLSYTNIVFYFHTPQCGTWQQRDSACRYRYCGGIGSTDTWPGHLLASSNLQQHSTFSIIELHISLQLP